MKFLKCFVMLVGVISSLGIAESAQCFTAQQLWAPYVVIEDEWWSGGSLHNQSSETELYSFSFYDPEGNRVGGKCILLEANEQKTLFMQDFTYPGEIDTGRYSVYIRTAGMSQNKFSFTLFVANSADSMGFGFQTYNSEDFETESIVVCWHPEPPLLEMK